MLYIKSLLAAQTGWVFGLGSLAVIAAYLRPMALRPCLSAGLPLHKLSIYWSKFIGQYRI